jgi:hypothetical protein
MVAKDRWLTFTAYPAGPGPYTNFEVTTPAGEVLLAGALPWDEDAVRGVCEAYHQRMHWEDPDA